MAIAFARVSIHTRSKGHSAIAASAYRTGLKLNDERTGLAHDYSHRNDVTFEEVLLPSGADEKFLDRNTLWNEIERIENRKNSQLCKDVVLALPKELDLVQQIELAKRFANHHFVQHGLVADIAIHDCQHGNPHAHMLITTRRLESAHFSKYKARDLNPDFANGFIKAKDYWGEQWRDFQVEFFQSKGLNLNVDLNHIIPEEHQGRYKNNQPPTLNENNQLIRKARREIALTDINNFINLLSLKASVFSRRDVERLLFKSLLVNDNQYLSTIEKVLSHKDVIELGLGSDGNLRYTTRHHYIQECKLFEKVESLLKKHNHASDKGLANISKQYGLSQEQSLALNYLANSPDIVVLCGKPGTGKTYLLKALNEHYSNIGYKTLGAALASKAAKGLEAESGIKSSTLASINYRLTTNKLNLEKNSIVIVDEAGMADFPSINHLISAVQKAGSKLILVGDSEQLKPIGKGDLFRGISSRVGYFSMEDIRRQRDQGDRNASITLSKGDPHIALSHYEQKKALHWSSEHDISIQHTVASWSDDLKNSSLSETVMLSFTRKAVLELNTSARHKLKELGQLEKDDFEYNVIRGDTQTFDHNLANIESSLALKPVTKPNNEKILLTKGERILFRKKDISIGVDNGDMGIITDINNESFSAKLDSGNNVTIPKDAYKHFDYGYALTVHKSQGMTVDNAHVVIDSPYWDKHLSYVAMTRHRDNLNIYANKSLHADLNELSKSLSRKPIKDNVIDWPLDYAIRYGFDPDSLVGRVINKAVGFRNSIKDKWVYLKQHETKRSFQREMVATRNKHRASFIDI